MWNERAQAHAVRKSAADVSPLVSWGGRSRLVGTILRLRSRLEAYANRANIKILLALRQLLSPRILLYFLFTRSLEACNTNYWQLSPVSIQKPMQPMFGAVNVDRTPFPINFVLQLRPHRRIELAGQDLGSRVHNTRQSRQIQGEVNHSGAPWPQ
jgi:hypothetical protein